MRELKYEQKEGNSELRSPLNTCGEKGYYVLFLKCTRDVNVKIKDRGEFYFKRGYYAYIGSSFIRGGIQARLRHHLKKKKKKFWHIDFLTSNESFTIAGYICLSSQKRGLEAELAEAAEEYCEPYIKGFGATDTKDAGHLFFIGEDVFEFLYHFMKGLFA
ncbi:GIY-YIG nuclease family protein [Fervidicoccus fontis]|uniref:Endonuclease III n=1 Tax=Fervidicoccus fontis (strain DSM 19380 / JCM 18336 / VKM B-2539 / Kam940) TaxID=1163730 RepID=H9ZZE8_FERFK|nr:GIY-YIG nuclease family protein [Fervidicoccus fontis]AFH42105.1 Endonuclease III [Fervidicoccus fontis Kam940]